MKHTTLMAFLALFATSFAVEDVLSVKTGVTKFSVLTQDMKSGVEGATLGFVQSDNADNKRTATTDKDGKVEMNLENGRYILELSGTSIAVLEATADGQLEEIKLVPEKLLVGGEEENMFQVPGAGPELIEVELGKLVVEDGVQFIETIEGVRIRTLGELVETAEGTFVQGADLTWFKAVPAFGANPGGSSGGFSLPSISSLNPFSGGGVPKIIVIAAGVVGAVIIADQVSSSDDDDGDSGSAPTVDPIADTTPTQQGGGTQTAVPTQPAAGGAAVQPDAKPAAPRVVTRTRTQTIFVPAPSP